MNRHSVQAKQKNYIFTLALIAFIALIFSFFMISDANAGNSMDIALQEIAEIEAYEAGEIHADGTVVTDGSFAQQEEIVTIQDEDVPLAGVIVDAPTFPLLWIGFLAVVMIAGLITYGRCARE